MAQDQTEQRKSPRTLSEFREFTANNPKIVTLQNGKILRMLSGICGKHGKTKKTSTTTMLHLKEWKEANL